MYRFRRLKVRKDPRTNIYVYHLDDDFEFHSLDKNGYLFNVMRTTLLPESGTLMVESWADEEKQKLNDSYMKTQKYQDYLKVNEHTRFDVEPFQDVPSLPPKPIHFWWGLKTTDPLIDKAIHKIADTLFQSCPDLIHHRSGLTFTTVIEDYPKTWFHYISITEEQSFLKPKKETFDRKIREALGSFKINYQEL